MLEGEALSDWIVPIFNGQPRINKPPLIYWIQAGIARAWARFVPDLAADNIDALPTGGIGRFRIASFLGTLAAVLALWAVGRAMGGGGQAMLAAALFASCTVVMFDVRQARTDQWLTAWTVIAMGALWQIVRPVSNATGWRWPLMFWLALAMGMLTKGPVCPVVCGGAVAVLAAVSSDRSWLRRLRVGWGVAIVASVLAAYVVPLAYLVGAGTLLWTFADEVLWRAAAPKEGHFAPPGIHLLLLPVLFWPGSLGLAPALVHTWAHLKIAPRDALEAARSSWFRRWLVEPLVDIRLQTAAHGVSAELFCVAWILPGWLAFELSMTKLPHYTLPLYPAIALLCARGLMTSASGWQPFLQSRLSRPLLWGWFALTVLLTVGVLLAAVLLFEPQLDAIGWFVIALAGAFVLFVNGLIAAALKHNRFVRVQILAVLLAAITLPVTFHFVLPNAQRLWISSRLVRELERIDPAGTRPLAAIHYHEDSLVYLTAGRVQRLRWRDVPDWMDQNVDGLLVMNEVLLPRGRRVERLATIEGYNIGGGGYERVMIAQPVSTGDAAPVSPCSAEPTANTRAH